jgi:A/G-specific adenine glycosylase
MGLHRLQRARGQLLEWFSRYGRDLPWRRTRDPFKVLLAELLLKLTPYWKAVRAFNAIVRRYPSPQALARARARDLEPIIRPLGLLHRAKALPAVGAALVRDHGGVVPDRREALDRLPGVGRYTAGAVLCFAFGRASALVDTTTARFYRRFFGLAQGPGPAEHETLWIAARRFVGRRRARNLNLAVIDICSMVCKFARPRCHLCPVASACHYYASKPSKKRA